MLAGATPVHIGQVEPSHELPRLAGAARALTSRGPRLRREIYARCAVRELNQLGCE
jgi:hypothetical protein